MENTAGRVSFFWKIFWACAGIGAAFAAVFSAQMFLFVNGVMSEPIYCLVFIAAIAAMFGIYYLVLSKFYRAAKALSKTKQKIEAVGYLASGFSHEYNNMFAAVLGAAEVLSKNSSKENQEYIDIVINTTKRASLLTNQLFGSARKTKIEMAAVDMHQTLGSVFRILKKSSTPNIHFHENFQAENWNITGNQHQIRNALINLGINAVESIGKDKQGDIYFRTSTTEFLKQTHIGIFTVEAGNYFTISIEDTSDGFSANQLEKIFDPYYSAAENKGNFGIRLASVLATVSQHNGAVLAQSKENYGTTFTIYLPFSGRNFDTAKIDTAKIADGNKNGISIMVVEDEPLVRKVVSTMLNRIGYSVIAAPSGLDAIEIYGNRQDEIALVILDMVMPNMDGTVCFGELKKINENVKVLVSSGLIDNSSIEDMKKDGLCGFITKPYSYAELEKAVANALQM